MVTAAQAKAISERYAKAVELVKQGKVFRLYGGREGDYIVTNGEGTAYLVNLISGECTCPDSQYRCSKLGIPCKHLLAVELERERQQAPAPQPEPEPAVAADVLAAASYCQGCGSPLPSGWLCTDCETSARGLLNDLL